MVAKAWADDDYKQRLLADPAAVFQLEGIAVPPNVELRAVENTDKVMYLTLPTKPSEELSDEQLGQVAGGSTLGSASTVGSLASICLTISTAASAGTAGCANG